LLCCGCILPKGDTSATSKEFALSAIWTELKGKVDYEATESRPDGTQASVKLKISGTTNIDDATQAKLAELQMLQNTIMAGIQIGQAAVAAASKPGK
jgi:hypothetical protein